jgi:hypothetical protein
MKQFASLSLAILLLNTASCSKVEKRLDNFQKTTSNLDSTASVMSKKAEDIKQIASAIFPQIRSGDTIRVRNEEWDILTNEDKGLGEKMVAGGIFFQALEYQFWTAYNADTAHVLELMYRDAADEFQGRMYDLYRKVDRKDMSPLMEGKRYSSDMAFYALAFTMDRSHHFQEELSRKYPNLKFVTFQDIIRNALTKEKNGQKVERHEAILLSGINKEIIQTLYHARTDILTAMALRDLVDPRNMTIGNYSKAAVFMITGGRFGAIEVPETYDHSNEYTKNNIINYLNEAIRARDFLASIGIKHKMEKKLKSALSAIDFNEASNDSSEDKTREEIRRLIQKLM